MHANFQSYLIRRDILDAKKGIGCMTRLVLWTIHF